MVCVIASNARLPPAARSDIGEKMSFPGSVPKALRVALAALALALLASCGGGEVVRFKPTRILAFGDELSVIEADGRKYTVNAFATQIVNGATVDDPTKLDCARNPLWIQTVGSSFGLVYDRCPGAATNVTGQVLAQVGHKVADLPAQIAAVQGAALNDLDLAVVMMGMNDVLELYAQYPTTARDTLLAQAAGRGAAMGNQVNALAQSGPAVVVLTMPDIGLSPFAKAADTAAGDTSRSALLSDLVRAFNDRMTITLINDGRLIGLAYGDAETQNEAKSPLNYGLLNATDAACLSTAPLPGCKPDTLVAGATAANYMWADALRLGPTTQARLGLLAAQRAVNNPF
jgi:outer membrane lipase/esterase